MFDFQTQDETFRNVSFIVFITILIIGFFLFFTRKNSSKNVAAWASFKSWLIAGPALFLSLNLEFKWFFFTLFLISIFMAKQFFQMTGMYHKSIFVWITYFNIFFLTFAHYFNLDLFISLSPMLLVLTVSLVPLLLNEYKNMIQYMALTLFNFLFVGWSFLHLLKIFQMENGRLLLLFIILLTQISDNSALIVGWLFGKKKILENITSRRTLEGIIASLFLTILGAFILKKYIPSFNIEFYWLYLGIITFMAGSLGDLVLAVFRKDLGVRDIGAFIIGRTPILDLMDPLIYVAPLFYYSDKLIKIFL